MALQIWGLPKWQLPCSYLTHFPDTFLCNKGLKKKHVSGSLGFEPRSFMPSMVYAYYWTSCIKSIKVEQKDKALKSTMGSGLQAVKQIYFRMISSLLKYTCFWFLASGFIHPGLGKIRLPNLAPGSMRLHPDLDVSPGCVTPVASSGCIIGPLSIHVWQSLAQ